MKTEIEQNSLRVISHKVTNYLQLMQHIMMMMVMMILSVPYIEIYLEIVKMLFKKKGNVICLDCV